MSTCENGHLASTGNYGIQGYWDRLKRIVMTLEDDYRAFKRRQATERALDRLSEQLRCDIGWPDLYERQNRELIERKVQHRG